MTETCIPLQDGLDMKLRDFGMHDLRNVEIVKKLWDDFFSHDLSALSIISPHEVTLLTVQFCESLGFLSKTISYSESQFVSFLKYEWRHRDN